MLPINTVRLTPHRKPRVGGGGGGGVVVVRKRDKKKKKRSQSSLEQDIGITSVPQQEF